MHYKTRHFVFHRIYEMASLVEDCVQNANSFIEVDWENPDVVKCVAEYSKLSLLHHYAFAMISVEQRHDLLHNDDLYEESEEMQQDLENTLDAYGVGYVPFKNFIVSDQVGEQDNNFPFRAWFAEQDETFALLWERMTDEVFHLLFANRALLLQFNQSLAAFLKSGTINIPTRFLDAKGTIRRQQYLPTWVKRAIYYRDQGRCVLCQRDLTGLLSTDQNIHFDHIVPLNLWGTNDPCNLQLLCDDCNLRKSGTSATTASRYYPWWDY